MPPTALQLLCGGASDLVYCFGYSRPISLTWYVLYLLSATACTLLLRMQVDGLALRGTTVEQRGGDGRVWVMVR
jgi:hypothetical protein